MLVYIQYVTLDMKNENKTTVLMLISPGKNALLNHRKSLKNGSLKHFVSLRKLNHICWPSFYTKNGYEKEICKVLRSEWIRIRNIAHKNFIFYRLLHTSISKVTNKEKTCFIFGWKFQFLVIFTRSKGKKQCANPVPLKFLARYVEVHNKTRTSSYQKVKNIWKRDYIAFLH